MLRKMVELFHETPEPSPAGNGESVTKQPGKLEFRNVRLAYGSNGPVLKDVSFTVPAGKTLGIVGASGTGKSTIVRLLVRLFEPDAGSILLDDADISEMPVDFVRRSIAVVPQDTILFDDTIGYNIGFGKPGSSQAEIERAARLAHLHDLIQRMPQQYETRIGERGMKLSGGERQRVSIARAALKRPRIFVFDEATSSLDSRTEREIVHNLHEVSRECTTVVIAHRLSTVVHADEIVVLDGGFIVERGTHAELLELDGHYAELWRTQQLASGQELPS
jgi:ATP-binding cassette, subfamily B, heavy metal transporter